MLCHRVNASSSPSSSGTISEKSMPTSMKEKLTKVFHDLPKENENFDAIVQDAFPGALSNRKLLTKLVDILEKKGFYEENTLLATSLCCDELARKLESRLNGLYGHHFALGGLSGFPFAGFTGFAAMTAHIPDNGFCFCVYAPHVGITKDGVIGRVERKGIALVDTCCGSAIKASSYVYKITHGGAEISTDIQEFTDFQQSAVNELILPHAHKLSEAKDRMVALPFAIYETQDLLMRKIIKRGSLGLKRGIAILGGIQINTSPETLDYFLPLRFELINYRGEVEEDLLPQLMKD